MPTSAPTLSPAAIAALTALADGQVVTGTVARPGEPETLSRAYPVAPDPAYMEPTRQYSSGFCRHCGRPVGLRTGENDTLVWTHNYDLSTTCTTRIMRVVHVELVEVPAHVEEVTDSFMSYWGEPSIDDSDEQCGMAMSVRQLDFGTVVDAVRPEDLTPDALAALARAATVAGSGH